MAITHRRIAGLWASTGWPHRVASWCTLRPKSASGDAPGSYLAHLRTGKTAPNLHQLATWCTTRPENAFQPAPGSYLAHLSAQRRLRTCTRWLLGALLGRKTPLDLHQAATWCTGRPGNAFEPAPGSYLVHLAAGKALMEVHQLATWCTLQLRIAPEPAPTGHLVHPSAEKRPSTGCQYRRRPPNQSARSPPAHPTPVPSERPHTPPA